MGLLLPGITSLGLLACLFASFRLEGRVREFGERARRAEEPGGALFELSDRERVLELNELVDEEKFLRDQTRVVPRGLVRICSFGGGAAAFLLLAPQLSAPRADWGGGLYCLVVGLAGALACAAWGGRARALLTRARQEVERLTSRRSARKVQISET